MSRKSLSKIDSHLKNMDQQYDRLITERNRLKPSREALWMATIYLLIGGLWILLSDKMVASIFRDPETLKVVQLYKGWFYVLATAVVFFCIFKKTLDLYTRSVDQSIDGYEALAQAHEELMAMNDDLRIEKELSNQFFMEAASIIVIFDKDETITHFNPVAEKVFGFKRNEVIGKMGYEILKSTEPVKKMREMFDEILDTENNRDNELEMLCKDGSYKTILWNNNPLHDKDGNITGLVSIGTDITERRQMEERLEHIAYYDTFLEIPNRTYLNMAVEDAIRMEKKFAVINLDLDNFRHINESMGHAVGDQFISTVTEVLKGLKRNQDLLARISVDQFAFLYFFDEEEYLLNWLDSVMARIRCPWNLNGQKIFVTCSMGIAVYPKDGETVTMLMQNSDIALYIRKEHGKDGYTFFAAEMYERTLSMIEMGHELKTAVENEEFILYYQPQFELSTGRLLGVEALIRWNHPEKGFISPGEFIPLSEKTGHIVPISEWVLKEAITQKRAWDQKGFPALKIAVNLSGYTFTESSVFDRLCQILDEMDVKPDEIEIEITETAVMMELEAAKEALAKLKERGLTIAMDDFGTGYSSLNYLQILPIDVLKIDQTFIRNIRSQKEETIYKTLVELAHAIGIRVVAEGVETLEQQEFLMQNNCDIGQGYFLGRPVSAQEVEEQFLKEV
ncbi:EAL domain-containing protein [Eubacteriaceae bacterium ES3]|nr:EAL domain-containing protein [Eubacteriaceae bacterium ES3]